MRMISNGRRSSPSPFYWHSERYLYTSFLSTFSWGDDDGSRAGNIVNDNQLVSALFIFNARFAGLAIDLHLDGIRVCFAGYQEFKTIFAVALDRQCVFSWIMVKIFSQKLGCKLAGVRREPIVGNILWEFACTQRDRGLDPLKQPCRDTASKVDLDDIRHCDAFRHTLELPSRAHQVCTHAAGHWRDLIVFNRHDQQVH